MWLAGARLQQCSWGEVDSDDTAQDVHLNILFPNNRVWHRYGERAWLDTAVMYQQAEHRDLECGREKPACPNPPQGLESTPGEPCRGIHGRVLERAGASCHSAGLKAKLEVMWQVQFPPRDGHLESCSWTWAGSPESQSAAANALLRKQSRRSAASKQPLVLALLSTLADDWLLRGESASPSKDVFV